MKATYEPASGKYGTILLQPDFRVFRTDVIMRIQVTHEGGVWHSSLPLCSFHEKTCLPSDLVGRTKMLQEGPEQSFAWRSCGSPEGSSSQARQVHQVA